MKRVLAIILAAITALSLCACQPQEQFDTVEICANELKGVKETEYVICVSKNIPDGQAILDGINKAIKNDVAEMLTRYDPKVSRPDENIALNMFMTLNEFREKEGDDPIHICASYFWPFDYTNGYGSYAMGIDMELCYIMAIEEQRSVIYSEPGMKAAYEMVKNGEADILASGIALTEQVKNDYLVSDVYATGKQQIVAYNVQRLHELKDLKGLVIGVIATKEGEKIVADAIANGVLKNSGAEMVVFDTDTEAKNALQNERISCIVLDELPAKRIVERIKAGR